MDAPSREDLVDLNITTMAARLLIGLTGGVDNGGLPCKLWRAIQLVFGFHRDKVNARPTPYWADN